jgi:hypothetical protein
MDPETRTDREVVFREVQRFAQWWIWLIVIAVAGIAWVTVIMQLFLGDPFGEYLFRDTVVLVIWVLVGILLPLLFVFASLIVEVRRDALHYRFVPFHRSFHRIDYVDIELCEARTYHPIREYGGWGIRWSRGGKAYNVKGDRGVQLVFTDGRRLLFGSQQADELASAINEAKKDYKESGFRL